MFAFERLSVVRASRFSRQLIWVSAAAAAAVLSACAPLETAGNFDGSVAVQEATQVPAPAQPAKNALQALQDQLDQNDEQLPEVDQSGMASWYGPGFHGRKTANGERFDQNALTAAHRKYAFGTQLCVRNKDNGKAVVVRVNDRGPYAHGRVLDLSKAAAQQIGMLEKGVRHVDISKLDDGDRCPGANTARG